MPVSLIKHAYIATELMVFLEKMGADQDQVFGLEMGPFGVPVYRYSEMKSQRIRWR